MPPRQPSEREIGIVLEEIETDEKVNRLKQTYSLWYETLDLIDKYGQPESQEGTGQIYATPWVNSEYVHPSAIFDLSYRLHARTKGEGVNDPVDPEIAWYPPDELLMMPVITIEMKVRPARNRNYEETYEVGFLGRDALIRPITNEARDTRVYQLDGSVHPGSEAWITIYDTIVLVKNGLLAQAAAE